MGFQQGVERLGCGGIDLCGDSLVRVGAFPALVALVEVVGPGAEEDGQAVAVVELEAVAIGFDAALVRDHKHLCLVVEELCVGVLATAGAAAAVNIAFEIAGGGDAVFFGADLRLVGIG